MKRTFWFSLVLAGATALKLLAQEPSTDPAAQHKPNQPAPGHAEGSFLGLLPPPDPEAVARGQTIFVGNCGFCHGSTANGGATGPDLVRSVIVLHDQGKGVTIAPVILNGRPDRGMPKFNLNDTQIKDVAAFLLSRNQAAANRMQYAIQNIVTGDPKAGEAYFTSRCASCHSATGDLAHIAGKYEPVALQSRFIYPQARRRSREAHMVRDAAPETTVTVTLASGKAFQGNLVALDDFSVALIESSGEYHSWLFETEKDIKVETHDPLEKHAELLKQYSDADMHNILAYLETLK